METPAIDTKKYSLKKLPAGFCVAFSSDGTKLACSGTRIHVLNPISLKRVSVFKPFANISAIDFSPSGEKIVAKNTSGRIAIIDSNSGEIVVSNSLNSTREGCRPRFLFDGGQVVVGDWDGNLSILSTESFNCLRVYPYAHEMISEISLNKNSTTMLVEHQPKAFGKKQIPDKSYVMIHQLPLDAVYGKRLDFKESISTSRISNDGTKVAFVEEVIGKKSGETVKLGGKLKIADIKTNAIISESNDVECYRSLEWSTDDKQIFAATNDSFVLHESTSLLTLRRQPAEFPSSIAFHPNGDLVALGTWRTTSIIQLSKFLS
jgi:WD40 repeat protein